MQGKVNTTTNLPAGVSVSLQTLLKLRAGAKSIKLSRRKKLRTQLLGGHNAVMRGRGMDFDEVRSYQAGDDIRHMDWRVTARTGKPHIKLYHEERERPVYLVIDMSPSLFFGSRICFKSVMAAKVAALLAWATVDNGDRVGGIIFGKQKEIDFRPRSRMRGLLPLLKALANNEIPEAETSNENALSNTLKKLRTVAKPGSALFIISDFANVNIEANKQLSLMAPHIDITACQLYDDLERTLPPPNRYPITDGKNIITIDTGSKKFCRAFHQQTILYQSTLEETFIKLNIPLLQIATHDDPLKKLRGMLQC